MENIILRNYLDDLKNGLDVFYKEYERSIDPTSFLISKKAKWLFESDIIYTKTNKELLLSSIIKDINKTLMEHSNDKFSVLNVEIYSGEIHLFLGTHNEKEKLVSWKLFSGEIRVRHFDLINKNNDKISIIKREIKEKNRELLETSTILANKDALANNGMFVAYTKSVLRPRKFKKDSEYIIETIEADIEELNANIKAIEDVNSEIKEDTNTREILEKLAGLFSKFPRIKGLSQYNRDILIKGD